jgi:hypothetical protein
MEIIYLWRKSMEKKNKTIRKREKCSDCYYNGKCNIPISKCKYLKQNIE